MDYLPSTEHIAKAGVYYNANKVGGIHYSRPHSASTAIKIDPPFNASHDPNEPRPTYRIKLNARKNPRPQKAAKVKKVKKKKIKIVKRRYKGKFKPKSRFANKPNKKNKLIAKKITDKKTVVYNKPEAPKPKAKTVTIGSVPNYKGRYAIKINGAYSDFTSEGIKKAALTIKEQEWLSKANYYFLNVTSKGRRIGSSAKYTNKEILHGLWSTARHVGIDPKRFIVQIFNETRFNPNLTGRAGEKGLGQFKYSTAKAQGYSWKKMGAGSSTYAYQAKAAAEFVKKVGEQTYNGRGRASQHYVARIAKHIKGINGVRLKDTKLAAI